MVSKKRWRTFFASTRKKKGRQIWLPSFERLERRYALHGDHVHDSVIEGIDSGDESGRSVYSAGDINSDGIDDFLIGAARADHSTVIEDGEVYVVFGKSTGLASTIDPSTLNGTNGFRIDGDLANDHFGLAVSNLGDINGDGRSDIVIGAPDADPSGRASAGSVYVLFGASSFGSSVDVTTLNGSNGFRIDGATAGDGFGVSVRGAGDVNKDGLGDFVIGAPGADFTGGGAGAAYVFFGAASFPAAVSLSSLTGANGFRIDGSAAGDDLGRSVSDAGDVNQDGFSDIIVGGPGATVSSGLLTGSAFLVFGKASGFSATLATTSLTGSNGFRINGFDVGDQFGQSVSSAGDFNADGFADVLIGSPRSEVNGVSVGAGYLVFGKANGFVASIAVSSLNGANGFRIALDFESDPWLNSWNVNTTGATGFARILADVQTVVPDATDVFVHTEGVPSYGIGPWNNNPNTVRAQNANYQIPRDPVANAGSKTATGLGAIAVWVDGTAIFNASDGISYNNQNVWHQNAYFFEKISFDSCNGHPPQNGLYHTHIVPACLRTELGDTGTTHSPILGWSFDGFPIYGPMGFANVDGSGGVARLNTSWQTRNITTRTTLANGTSVTAGPTIATKPIGSYLEDYQYTAGSGHLDQFNGRFSVTPEFPDGIYHYVVTIDAAGIPAYPYIIGPTYNGIVETKNTTRTVGSPAATQISVARIGDTNGDGISDIAIGDQDAYAGKAMVAGGAFVVFGHGGAQVADFHLHKVDGNNGHHFHGLNQGGLAGTSVAAAGDVNRDGSSDLIVGAPLATAAGDITAGRSFIINGLAKTLLIVTSNNTTISENGGSTTAIVTRTVPSLVGDLIVSLSSSDTSEATVPAFVTILSGQASASFVVTGQDDTLLDGGQSVVITASSTSFSSGTLSILVSDFEVLSLAITAAAMSERNSSTSGTISRNNSDLAFPITVNLTSNDLSEAIVPSSVTIPANESFANFAITSVDDALLDGTQAVTITAASAAYITATAGLDITDYETLSLSFLAGSISEKSGTTTGTLTRSNSNIQSALTVTLLSDDLSEATVPVSVTIPANSAFVTFTISAVDDNVLDGTQTVSISAVAEGFINGIKTIDVTDYESLKVIIVADSISERFGSTTGVVTRDGAVGDLTVLLSSNDLTESKTVASITLLDGQTTSGAFAIDSVDDTLLDGTQSVAFSASAAGYVTGQDTLLVTDYEMVSLAITASSISEKGGVTTATVTRGNTDIALPCTVSLLSFDTSEISVPTSVTLPANASSFSFAVTAVDDALLDGTQTVQISVSSSGYVDAGGSIDVLDYEFLQVMIELSSIPEKNGSTTGTVSRSNSDNSQPLTVFLTSSDTGEATVPMIATIPAGSAFVDFVIASVDDGIVDGNQAVTITASSTGYIAGTKSIEIRESLSLSLIIDTLSIQEAGGQATGRLTRNDSSGILVVRLASNDTSEATVPMFISFAAGDEFVDFVIMAVDDTLFDGNQIVVISAKADDAPELFSSLTVIDTDFSTPFRNPRESLDVNDDGFINPLDVLVMINWVNSNGFSLPAAPEPPTAPFYDTDGDNLVSPIDILQVINFLNRPSGGEGESDTKNDCTIEREFQSTIIDVRFSTSQWYDDVLLRRKASHANR